MLWFTSSLRQGFGAKNDAACANLAHPRQSINAQAIPQDGKRKNFGGSGCIAPRLISKSLPELRMLSARKRHRRRAPIHSPMRRFKMVSFALFSGAFPVILPSDFIQVEGILS